MNDDWLVSFLYVWICRRIIGIWTHNNSCFQVCGGGPHLALYHLRSLTLSRVLLEEDPHAVNSVVFNDDSIVVGMNGPFVYHVLFSGDITCKTPTTPLRVYSLALQKGDKKVHEIGLEIIVIFVINCSLTFICCFAVINCRWSWRWNWYLLKLEIPRSDRLLHCIISPWTRGPQHFMFLGLKCFARNCASSYLVFTRRFEFIGEK